MGEGLIFLFFALIGIMLIFLPFEGINNKADDYKVFKTERKVYKSQKSAQEKRWVENAR